MDGQHDPSPAVGRVLDLVRSRLGMDVAWVSRFTRTEQVFVEVGGAAEVWGPARGGGSSLASAYCARVLRGELPNVITDARQDPRTRDLPATAELGIGAYVGAPVRDAAGAVVGMLCCISHTARPDLEDRERAVLEVLAGLIEELEPVAGQALSALRERVLVAIGGQGRSVVLQPIVDVRTGLAPGAEALSRFDGPPYRPDLWFQDAQAVDLRVPLELAAAADALALLSEPAAPGYVSVNLSPDAIVSGSLPGLLRGVDVSRVVIEVTEHAAVIDYEQVLSALSLPRARGLRLAVDDAGAGFASLRHVLQLAPDLVKLDVSLVRDIDSSPTKQALAHALVTFAERTGAVLVAEGVETQAEYDEVAGLGVDLVQGYLLARPGERSPSGRYRTPGRRPPGTRPVSAPPGPGAGTGRPTGSGADADPTAARGTGRPVRVGAGTQRP